MQVQQIGGVSVIAWPQVRTDGIDSEEFGQGFAPSTPVVLDLSALGFIDSSGLGALVDYLERLLNRGVALKLGGVCKAVRTSLELLRLHRLVEMFSTKEEAVLAYKK